jgi:hypothetical protein
LVAVVVVVAGAAVAGAVVAVVAGAVVAGAVVAVAAGAVVVLGKNLDKKLLFVEPPRYLDPPSRRPPRFKEEEEEREEDPSEGGIESVFMLYTLFRKK